MYVYVLNKHGEPLMPCKPRKARILLKEKKAKVVKKTPFTIKLLYGSSGYKQDITLDVDAGSTKIDLSAASKKQELFKDTVTLRHDNSDLRESHKNKHKTKKNKKRRYRKPKSNNRGKKDKQLPKIKNKKDSRTKAINEVCSILPVTQLNVERGEVDMETLKKPDIHDAESQNGKNKD